MMRFIKLLVLSFLMTGIQSLWAEEVADLPEGIMAVRGDGSVSREIFDASLADVPAKDRPVFLSSGRRVESRMADLLMNSQLVAAAREAGFDEGDVRYQMQLAADRALAAAWLAHYVRSQPPADYEALAYEAYLLNKDKLVTQETIDVTHLLVSYENSSEEEAMEQAQAFLDQIHEDPAVFEELIRNHSEDPAVSRNKGKYKGVKKGDMVKGFEDAAFALTTPGEFSGLVPARHGVHIIRLDAINPSRTLEFDEVKQQLMAQKEKEHRERVQLDYLNSLSSLPWTVSEEELGALLERHGVSATPSEDSAAAATE
jgi:peptidyl-prolyl cis-trans isomerase C